MSQPFSRCLHPFDVAHHPSLEPEVRRAILASWTSNERAVESQPAIHKISRLGRPVPIDEKFPALRSLDAPESRPSLQ